MPSTSFGADIGFLGWDAEKSKDSYSLTLDGEIERGDLQKLLMKIKKKGYMPHILILTSPGGDVDEAINIGRFIRESLIYILPGYQCLSSCFLVFVAGVDRRTGSLVELGAHRPYYDPSYFKDLTPKQAEKKQRKAMEDVSAYLREMGVAQHIVDKIMNVPSNKLWMMSSEWYRENIGFQSAGFGEWVRANCGEALTDQEYRDLASTDYGKKSNGFSRGYITYLKSNWQNYNRCLSDKLDKARKEIFNNLHYFF